MRPAPLNSFSSPHERGLFARSLAPIPHPTLLRIVLGEANEIPILMNDHQAPKQKRLLLLLEKKGRRKGEEGKESKALYKANIRK